jgi:hypothetical protein
METLQLSLEVSNLKHYNVVRHIASDFVACSATHHDAIDARHRARTGAVRQQPSWDDAILDFTERGPDVNRSTP